MTTVWEGVGDSCAEVRKLGKVLGFRPDFVRRQISTMNDKIVGAIVLLSGELNKNPETASPIYKRITAVINSN